MSAASDTPSAAGDFDVVGLGFCCLDELLLLERIPRAEEQVTVHDRALEGGGMAATAMVAVTRLGGRAAFIGAIGDDATGAQIRQGFAAAGVDVTQLWLHPGATSNRTFVLVDRRNAARSFLAQFGGCGTVPPSHLDRQYLRRGRMLHLSDPGPAALQAATWARASGQEVCYDGTHYHPDDLALLPLVDYLIVSRFFGREFARAHAIPPGESLVAVAQALRDHGPPVVVITEGERGAVCVEPAGAYRVPAFAVEPMVDTTGAGDVYHGAFLFARARGCSVRDSLLLASATAALKCRRLGGRAGIPSLAEAEALMASGGEEGTRNHDSPTARRRPDC